MSIMNRKPGFYWVNYSDGFEIARWESGYWYLTAMSIGNVDEEMIEIDERRIERTVDGSDV